MESCSIPENRDDSDFYRSIFYEDDNLNKNWHHDEINTKCRNKTNAANYDNNSQVVWVENNTTSGLNNPENMLTSSSMAEQSRLKNNTLNSNISEHTDLHIDQNNDKNNNQNSGSSQNTMSQEITASLDRSPPHL